MSRIVVILPTQTYRAAEFIEASNQLGVDLVVASEGDAPIDMGPGYIRIDCSDVEGAAEEIVAYGDQNAIDGVVAADDSGVVIAALAATRLGLPSNPVDAARATRDKAQLRRLLTLGEVPQPDWLSLGADDNPQRAAEPIGYPLVVKPLSRAASQGVIRADTPDDLPSVVSQVRSILAADGARDETLLLEKYVKGDEVAVEGVVGPEGLVALTIFDKPDRPTGPAFPETILVTPSRHPGPLQNEILRVAEMSIRALGLTNGPVHIELILGPQGVQVIEVAARSIGGLCSRSLSFGLMDTSLETLILRNAIGRDKRELRRAPGASGVLMIPIPRAGLLESIDGLGALAEDPAIVGHEITAPIGSQVAPPPQGDRYLGFVFAKSETPDEVEAALTRANKLIEVQIG